MPPAPRHFRLGEVEVGDFAGAGDGCAVGDDFGDDAPVLRRLRCDGRRVQKPALGPPRPGAVGPGREDAVARHDAPREMRQIAERGAFRCDNNICHQRIFRVDVCAALDRCDHRHADVGGVLDDLHALVMDLAPDVGVRHIAEGREVDCGHVVARARQDHYLVVAVLCDVVKSLCELGMVLR